MFNRRDKEQVTDCEAVAEMQKRAALSADEAARAQQVCKKDQKVNANGGDRNSVFASKAPNAAEVEKERKAIMEQRQFMAGGKRPFGM